MSIRRAKEEDAGRIAQLLGQLGYPDDEASSRKKINEHGKDGYALLVAEEGGVVIGFLAMHWYAALHRPNFVGRITALCVDEKWRGTGKGSELLRKGEEELIARGCIRIEITSNKRRESTHKYYLRRGYEEKSIHFVKDLKS